VDEFLLSRYNRAMRKNEVVAALEASGQTIAPVVPFDLRSGRLEVFDFTAANTELAHLDINDVAGFTGFLFERIAASEIPVGIGRYNEDRVLYRHSPLFDGTTERRSVHLGIDLFVVEGTGILAPLPAVVHSLADNAGLGDYGPTVILEHELNGARFFTLYGHLSRDTLAALDTGRKLEAGQALGAVGDVHENGGWPPHLHFQIICEEPAKNGDYPGVAAPSERERYLALCPDPNLILRIPGL
jgi:murein DD-endopeptidase MepM/ murein hydrolase activator NlpD